MIKIETKKEVSSAGVKGYRVVKVEALKDEELPRMYVNNIKKDRCCIDFSCVRPRLIVDPAISNKQSRFVIDVGNFYSADKLHNYLETINLAGIWLREVNITLKTLKCQWVGKRNFKF